MVSVNVGDCLTIEAKAIIKKPDSGLENGEITIEAKGGKGELRYIFFNEKGYPINSTKEKVNSMKNLKQGTYRCAIVDEVGCIKQLVIGLN